jgi:hypothetical protein
MVLGSVGNGNGTPNYDWGVALLSAQGEGTFLPAGTLKTALTGKAMSTLLEAYNTHYVFTNGPYQTLSWQQAAARWEILSGSKPMFYTEESGNKASETGLAAPTFARCLIRALHTWAGQYSSDQRKLLAWQWGEYPRALQIAGAESASMGKEVLIALSGVDFLGTGNIVELGNASGVPTAKPLADVLKLLTWNGTQYVEIANTEYDAYLFAKAGQNPITDVVLFIIPTLSTVPLNVGRILMDCPFASLPAGYVLNCTRLHISRLSFSDPSQDAWAWGMPAVSVVMDQFPGYSQGPKKTLRITKQGSELPDPKNWRIGKTETKELVANEPLDPRLHPKQDVLCFSIRLR